MSDFVETFSVSKICCLEQKFDLSKNNISNFFAFSKKRLFHQQSFVCIKEMYFLLVIFSIKYIYNVIIKIKASIYFCFSFFVFIKK